MTDDTPAPFARSPEFAQASLDFVEQLNSMVTRLIGSRGRTSVIPEEDTTPEVEAAAVILAAAMYSVCHGDYELLTADVWPHSARANLRLFTEMRDLATSKAGQ